MSRTKESVFKDWFVAHELERINRNARPTLEMFLHSWIFDALEQNDPESLIEFVREGGDIRKFGAPGLDMIARVLRGKKLRGKGRPPKEWIRIRNARLCFYVAWFHKIEDYKLTDPRRARNTAFDKAVKAIGGITARTASNQWGECDQDYYLAAVSY